MNLCIRAHIVKSLLGGEITELGKFQVCNCNIHFSLCSTKKFQNTANLSALGEKIPKQVISLFCNCYIYLSVYLTKKSLNTANFKFVLGKETPKTVNFQRALSKIQ